MFVSGWVKDPVSPHSVVLVGCCPKGSPGVELGLQKPFMTIPGRQNVKFIERRSASTNSLMTFLGMVYVLGRKSYTLRVISLAKFLQWHVD